MHVRSKVEVGGTPRVRPLWLAAGEVSLIFLVFYIQGAWHVPSANEPHYLSKARHYWDPTWCPGDFFLSTADAHLFFYWSFGWLSKWLPLPTLAWCGRLLTWGLLAWSWRRLSWALVPLPLYSVLSAALMATLNDRFQMAGEWLIGGVEAKGFAYALVFFGLESLVRGRWTAAWLSFGAASAFHVIVGGWATVAGLVVWLVSPDRPSPARTAAALAGGLLLALPGLVPAVALTWGTDPALVNDANQVYVYERLSHHLVPQRFPLELIIRHLLLIAALVALVPLAGADTRWRKLRAFVAAAVGLAAVGMLIGMIVPEAPSLAAALLRYYWFRLSDVMVPVGVALAAASVLSSWQRTRPAWHAAGLAAALVAVTGHFGQLAWLRHESDLPHADAPVANLAAWREMCDWAARETPPDAVFLTPRGAQTFRWYSGRGEAISRKDVPQDAAGIIQWWRRLQRAHLADVGLPTTYWRRSLTELGGPGLRELGKALGAQYVITEAEPPLALKRVGPQNASYAIYELSAPRVLTADGPKPRP